MKPPRKPSARTERRQQARDAEKLTEDLQRLAALEPGGAPERPIEVASASVVEPRAQSTPCARCRGVLRMEEHVSLNVDHKRLRVVRMRCSQCGHRQAVYFRLVSAAPN